MIRTLERLSQASRGRIHTWRATARTSPAAPYERRPGEELAPVLAERPADHDAALSLLGQPVDARRHPRRGRSRHGPGRPRRRRRGSRSPPRRPRARRRARPRSWRRARRARDRAGVDAEAAAVVRARRTTKHSANSGGPHAPTPADAALPRPAPTAAPEAVSVGIAGRASATRRSPSSSRSRSPSRRTVERACRAAAGAAASPRRRRRGASRGARPRSRRWPSRSGPRIAAVDRDRVARCIAGRVTFVTVSRKHRAVVASPRCQDEDAPMRIALAQLNVVVGDLDGNVERIARGDRARRGARARTSSSSPSSR